MRFSNPYVSLLEDFNSKLVSAVSEQWRETAAERLSELSRRLIPAENVVSFDGVRDSAMADFLAEVHRLVTVPYLGKTTEQSRHLTMELTRLMRDRRRQFTNWLIDPVEHFALLVNGKDELDCGLELKKQLSELQSLRDRTWALNGKELKPYLKLAAKIVESEEYLRAFGDEHRTRARIANDRLPLALRPKRNMANSRYAPSNPFHDVAPEFVKTLWGVSVPIAHVLQAQTAITEFLDSVSNTSVAELKLHEASECAEQVLTWGNVPAGSLQARQVRAAAVRFEQTLKSLQAGLNTYSAMAASHLGELRRAINPIDSPVEINVLNEIGESATLARSPEGLQRYLEDFEYMLRIAGLNRFVDDVESYGKLAQLTSRLEATAMLESVL